MKGNEMISLLAIFCMLCASVGAVNIDVFPYYKVVDTEDEAGPVVVNLDEDMFSGMQSMGQDLRIMTGTEEVAYRIFIDPIEEVAHQGRIFKTSSVRSDFRGTSFDGSKMLDGAYSSQDGDSYQNDINDDPELSWFILDLGEKKLTDTLRIWSSNKQYTWTDIMIEASNDMSEWDAIKAQTKYSFSPVRAVIYPPSQYRYLKVTLWHTQSLSVGEIEVYGAASGWLIFVSEPEKEYRIYYGNRELEAPDYDVSEIYQTADTPTGSLSAERANPYYNEDIDSDGVALSDNCPYIPNLGQGDSDHDGVGDACDNCIQSGNKNQRDSDHDGVGDVCDNCPLVPNKDQLDRDLNGIGYACDDSDHDGVRNTGDNCEYISNPGQEDLDNNGVGDVCEKDSDGDGMEDELDNCRYNMNPEQGDGDRDGIGDACDNCVAVSNRNQIDQDNNGVGDVCEDDYADDDGDGVVNSRDNCRYAPNTDQVDRDGDKVGDVCDNCPGLKNSDQVDRDSNGVGDICDDTDGDGILNYQDNCPELSNAGQADRNNNGIGDDCEDFDSDGVMNSEDNCLTVGNPGQRDVDHDGVGDACDEKDDRFTENKTLVWVVIVGVVLIVGFLAIRLFRKNV